jgi:23S rRNA pseudouridine1911/1915/1917 synthase
MNAVVARYPEISKAGEKPLEGGLVHRLDNGTSGALMIARSSESLAIMRSAIRGGRIIRGYLALVQGKLERPVEIKDRIAHHHKNPRKMVSSESGRKAFTSAAPLRAFTASTLVSVTPRTGCRHQIRVHLAGLGLPIIGDRLYGGPTNNRLPAGRFWLHLSAIEFDSPAGRHIRVESPLPDDLQDVLDEMN